MSKSALLRVQDVRDAYRLIGDCRDLGSDPALWQRRLFEGLRGLVGAAAATGGEGRWIRPRRPIQVLSAFWAGFDRPALEHFESYIRANGPATDPIMEAIRHVPGRLVTRTRRQLVSDAAWYRCRSFNEYRKLGGVDHQLTSIYQVSMQGAISGIHVHRQLGERDFSSRERRVLYFLHSELGPLVGRALVSDIEPTPARLSPRLRQTLRCLVEGDAEKQVAARLGLSQATTHQYVTMLYRRFGVQSRAQLLAHIIKRLWQGQWGTVLAGPDEVSQSTGPHTITR